MPTSLGERQEESRSLANLLKYLKDENNNQFCSENTVESRTLNFTASLKVPTAAMPRRIVGSEAANCDLPFERQQGVSFEEFRSV